MAFNPQKEEYERLVVAVSQSLDGTEPSKVQKEVSNLNQRFSTDRDSLPQNDKDRAFHLVVSAALIIDHQLPFVENDKKAEKLVAQGHRLIGEALSLDPMCYDAIRMDMASRCSTFDQHYDCLLERKDEVKAYCTKNCTTSQQGQADDRDELASNLMLRPYLRWLSCLASKALICGRNREALRFCDELFSLDPTDISDARFTAAYAYAKLEDEQGLDQLEARFASDEQLRMENNAWMLIARMALAYKRHNPARAHQYLERINSHYPHAVTILARQVELPDGVFARLAVAPSSEDELVIAASEAAILFQEGRDSFGCGSLGLWVLQESVGMATPKELKTLHDVVERMSYLQEGSQDEGKGGGTYLGGRS